MGCSIDELGRPGLASRPICEIFLACGTSLGFHRFVRCPDEIRSDTQQTVSYASNGWQTSPPWGIEPGLLGEFLASRARPALRCGAATAPCPAAGRAAQEAPRRGVADLRY